MAKTTTEHAVVQKNDLSADFSFDDIPDEWDPATPGEAFAGAALMLGSAAVVLGLAWSLVWAIGAAFFKGQN